MTDLSDDAEELAAGLQGDGEAFGRIFDKHRARLLRHCRPLTDEIADAEDAVAIVFLEAWRKRRSIRFIDGSMLPWLLVTATYTAQNLTRASRRHQKLLRRLPPPAPQTDITATIGDSDAEVALRSLSLSDRQLITLRVIEGFSEKDTATILNITVGTAKSRLSRAKKRLSAHLAHTSRTTLMTEAPHAQ